MWNGGDWRALSRVGKSLRNWNQMSGNDEEQIRKLVRYGESWRELAKVGEAWGNRNNTMKNATAGDG